MPPPPSRYLPLAQYLATQEAEGLTLSLAQIEAIIGFPLPPSAYALSGWWRDTAYAWVLAWAALGWKARLRVDERVVRFTRATRTEG